MIHCLLSAIRKCYIMRQQKPIIFLWIVRQNGTREINLFYHPLQTRSVGINNCIPQLTWIVFQIPSNSVTPLSNIKKTKLARIYRVSI